MAFKPVNSQEDFPALERELLDGWYKRSLPSDEGKEGISIVEKYLHKNDSSDKKFSFLDGPITANNPMGVHHAWGRTYKDLWLRWNNMRGKKERFQNGFDEQGLWVEVEVEKELGLKNKKDILNLVPGDEYASLEKFVNLCKARVEKYSAIQTNQSKRLGYFMDWDNSYHTSSEKNNYTIWNYLKTVWERGWIYKGHDSVPWCPRCGTAISQHEILTEDYKELTHDSIFFKLPLKRRDNEYLLVWTTTPWTIPANVAVAVNGEESYVRYEQNGQKVWVMSKALDRLIQDGILEKIPADGEELELISGSNMDGWEYDAPFDSLERVQKAMGGQSHKVVIGDPQILPVGADEGTGMVHVAPGAGTEDFRLGKKLELSVIEVIDEEANYLDMGEVTRSEASLSAQNAKKHPELIIDFLTNHDSGKFLFKVQKYTHRYPACWRCKTELVWRVVDEWYINMDGKDSDGSSYREQIKDVAKKISWKPKWALDRELDWLNNMHDWLISKKRFWGLALPVWECKNCGNFEVIGSRDELKERAVEGWDKFEGHTPHRPWIDQVKIKCSKCGKTVSRIQDVGNPWLDAGIVPFSTMPEDWFPADFITEGFPGQFKNWFYSLLTMSTALKRTNPFENILGFGNLVDEGGKPMHKSSGNSIEFNEAADKAGVDVVRWLYVTANPEVDLRFGFHVTDDIRRRYYLILWNVYKFFVDRASVEGWVCELERGELGILDKWILARLTELVLLVNKSLEKYDAQTASRAIEDFVINDLSTWYVRRSRDRVGSNAEEKERNMVLGVLYGNLVTLSKLLAPFMPFISEEMYRNLTEDTSVHLTDYPLGDQSLLNDKLVSEMKVVRLVVELGHSKRKEVELKLRQPLASATYWTQNQLDGDLEKIIAEELNVKEVKFEKGSELNVELDTNITQELKEEGEARDLIRSIQALRKEQNLTLKDRIEVTAPAWPKEFEEMILKATAADKISNAETLSIKKID
jgi:isoleucyl-tRNA synthetase